MVVNEVGPFEKIYHKGFDWRSWNRYRPFPLTEIGFLDRDQGVGWALLLELGDQFRDELAGAGLVVKLCEGRSVKAILDYKFDLQAMVAWDLVNRWLLCAPIIARQWDKARFIVYNG